MAQASWTQAWIAPVVQLARDAGAVILAEQARGLQIATKPDGSPASSADIAAEALIIAGLRRIAPMIPVVAEETANVVLAAPEQPFWLVDPLDGTKSFLAGTDDFTVNIALVQAGRPVFGVIHAPARRMMFWNDPVQAWQQSGNDGALVARTRMPPPQGLTLITSRRTYTGARLTSWLAAQQTIAEQLMLSSALKFCYVAMGIADIYPRLGPTMEWDNAAGEAILHAAGGTVTTPEGAPLPYGQPHFQHQGLVARGRIG